MNRYGIYVVSGIIFGFDTDSERTPDHVLEFIEASKIPFLTINVLHALPRTPLWRRLESEGRLVDQDGRESNIEFLRPYDDVVEGWRRCVTAAYEPEALFARFDYQLEKVFPNRLKLPASPARVNRENLLRGARIIPKLFWTLGVKSDYRRRFWKTALPAIRRGQLEDLIMVAVTTFHLIHFGREASRGHVRAGLYDPRPQRPDEVSAAA